ncbi:MAG TPA: hypothetical protein VFV86_06725, partial [Nitrososphaeraceae archaeon]|nr:hypothetical protein [Nitrososphaeraceae archaeon]
IISIMSSSSSSIEEKYFEIENLVRSKTDFWHESSFFFVTRDEYLRIYKGKFSKNVEIVKNATINGIIKVDRGKILDVFAKIEFLVNHLIIVQIVGFLSDKVLLVDDLLANVDLINRIKMLHNWKILDDSDKNRIIQLKNVRDGLAHRWDKSEIMYNGISLTKSKNFKKFKQDLIYVWNMLFDKYIQEEEKNIDEIVSKLKTLTENK